jgi:predicted SAM-dependent methyltransferase
MLALVRTIITRIGFQEAALRAKHRLRVATRAARGIDRRILADYLANSTVRKLHIGCGKHPLPGWLNTDFEPHAGEMFLDATQPFPLADESFDYIYSEHMIEHVPFPAGQAMFDECFRVLRPSGVLRISTPDLAFLWRIYQSPDIPLHRQYIEWAIAKHAPHAPERLPSFVVNNFVRNWDHQFIYDEPTLRTALANAGFSHIERVKIQHSDHDDLKNRENASRMPTGFLELESLILEARK